MRESIGGGMLLYLVIIFVTVVMLLFSSILTYSKAYKIKNRIIEIIEKYDTYTGITNELNSDLGMAGYNPSIPTRCESGSVQNHLKAMLPIEYHSDLPDNKNDAYNYCVFEINSDDYPKKISSGKYYVVVTFVEFQIPIIGDVLTIPVYGETKILGKNY